MCVQVRFGEVWGRACCLEGQEHLRLSRALPAKCCFSLGTCFSLCVLSSCLQVMHFLTSPLSLFSPRNTQPSPLSLKGK